MAAIKPIMVGTSPTSLVEIPAPTDIGWGVQRVSSSDAGRVNDANATMYVNEIARKRKISLSWRNPDDRETSAVLTAFWPEYVYVRYFEPKDAEFVVKQFYTGDMTAPFRQFMDGGGVVYQALSFNIIER